MRTSILAPVSEVIPRPPDSGTVYTPDQLAAALVLALEPSEDQLWLDPCVGDGAFLRALDKRIHPGNITALDLETRTGVSDNLLSGNQIKRGQDFLQWYRDMPACFHRIIANPPYVALSRVPSPLRERALSVVDPEGQRVRLGANYWYAFLCASLRLLRPGGSLGFILPAAWDYADYAGPLRRKLTDSFQTVEVHRCLEPMFRTVSDGCVVLIARDCGKANGQVTRYEYRSLDELVKSLSSFTAQRTQIHRRSEKGTLLADVLQIRLGGVTGDSKYFLLSEEERRRHDLPAEACVPVVSKARHLKGGAISRRDWARLKDANERIWLFRPEEQWVALPSVRKYLRRPADKGGCQRARFKINGREPWYQTPMPSVVHGFVSGMSRFGSWICLNGMKGLSATNTLYVVRFLKASKTKDEQAAWAMALLTSRARETMNEIKRMYPEGLSKIEPGDLAQIRIPTPTRFDGALSRYLEAAGHLLAGREAEAIRIADAWFV